MPAFCWMRAHPRTRPPTHRHTHARTYAHAHQQNFTQYIPLSLYELQSFITGPSIFVWDCSNAGQIVRSFDAFAVQRRMDYEVRLAVRARVCCVPFSGCDVPVCLGVSLSLIHI